MTHEQVLNWVVDYQNRMIHERYGGIQDAEELKEFFLNELYPPSDRRQEYLERNEFMKTAIKLYNAGRIKILLGFAVLMVAPLLAVASKIKTLPFYLAMMVNLYNLTTEMDNKVAACMHKRVLEGAEPGPELYNEAFRDCYDEEKRSRQIEYNVRLFEFIKSLVEHGGHLITVIERCPQLPLMTRNRYVSGINKSIAFGQRGFRAFKNARGQLDEFRLMLIEKEYGFIRDVMGFRGIDEISRAYVHVPIGI